jgi:Protein of unknown function (DUF551).
MEWISVKDRLPEDYLIVKGKNNNGEIVRCFICEEVWQDDSVDSLEPDECLIQISQWMPFSTQSKD